MFWLVWYGYWSLVLGFFEESRICGIGFFCLIGFSVVFWWW